MEGLEALLGYLHELGRDPQEHRPSMSAADRAQASLATIVAATRKLRFAAQNLHDAEAERELAKVEEQVARLVPQISGNPQHVLEEGGKLNARLRQLQAGLGAGGRSAQRIDIPELYN